MQPESVRIHRRCRRLYPPAADAAAPGAPRGDGGTRTAAVEHARLRTIGPPLAAVGHGHGGTWGAWGANGSTAKPANHGHGAAWRAWGASGSTAEPADGRGGGEGDRSRAE